MTRDDIIRMAFDAGFTAAHDFWPDVWAKEFERFAALVAEAERKACTELVSSYLISMSADVYVALASRRNK
jgi:hypothetical protein